jgi:hypothetical protein
MAVPAPRAREHGGRVPEGGQRALGPAADADRDEGGAARARDDEGLPHLAVEAGRRQRGAIEPELLGHRAVNPDRNARGAGGRGHRLRDADLRRRNFVHRRGGLEVGHGHGGKRRELHRVISLGRPAPRPASQSGRASLQPVRKPSPHCSDALGVLERALGLLREGRLQNLAARLSSTLSGVAVRTRTKSAELPGGRAPPRRSPARIASCRAARRAMGHSAGDVGVHRGAALTAPIVPESPRAVPGAPGRW